MESVGKLKISMLVVTASGDFLNSRAPELERNTNSLLIMLSVKSAKSAESAKLAKSQKSA